MYTDPDGHDPVFYLREEGSFYPGEGGNGEKTWHFVMDMKGMNVIISLYGFVPFLDNAIWGAADLMAGTKTVTQDMYQDIAMKISASLSAADVAARLGGITGPAGKLASTAGKASYLFTLANIFYETRDERPYYNEITADLFRGYYESASFETTTARFFAYELITEDLVKNGIVTYEANWGYFKGYKVDWDKYREYFEKLGIASKDIGQMIQ
jgi:hypothetical protein